MSRVQKLNYQIPKKKNLKKLGASSTKSVNAGNDFIQRKTGKGTTHRLQESTVWVLGLILFLVAAVAAAVAVFAGRALAGFETLDGLADQVRPSEQNDDCDQNDFKHGKPPLILLTDQLMKWIPTWYTMVQMTHAIAVSVNHCANAHFHEPASRAITANVAMQGVAIRAKRRMQTPCSGV